MIIVAIFALIVVVGIYRGCFSDSGLIQGKFKSFNDRYANTRSSTDTGTDTKDRKDRISSIDFVNLAQ